MKALASASLGEGLQSLREAQADVLEAIVNEG